MIQDFYAHTTWTEIYGQKKVSKELVTFGDDFGNVAGANEETCSDDCVVGPAGGTCTNNVKSKRLTSPFREGLVDHEGKSIAIPQGG
jgi:hypothetical protein